MRAIFENVRFPRLCLSMPCQSIFILREGDLKENGDFRKRHVIVLVFLESLIEKKVIFLDLCMFISRIH